MFLFFNKILQYNVGADDSVRPYLNFFSKKNLILLFIISLLLILLAYVTNITSIPDSVILFEDDELSLETIAGVKIKEKNDNTVEASTKLNDNKVSENNNSDNKKEYNLSLLGVNLKTITANILPETKVVPLGDLVGLKLYTKGVLVVGISEIKGEDNKTYKPYEEAGIEQGDSIIKINNEKIESTEDLLECVSKTNGKTMNVTYIKGGEEVEKTITPVKTSKNTYKLGIWVRDAGAGVGTLSFYDETTNTIASLGHGIQDVDTEEMLDISSGEIVTAEIVNVKKGEENNPGKIEGTIEDSKNLGTVYSNTRFGVYGKINNKNELNIDTSKAIKVALRNEIKEGDAKIICTLEDGKKEEYNVKIQKIFKNNNEDNKSMIVKVTDERLLEKTGGIIQGMSGSPIIQNGKMIGTLTHVLVSDPTTGYGVFADLMIKQMRSVE